MIESHLKQLISIPSVSGNEQQVGDYIAESCSGPRNTSYRIGVDVAVRISGRDPGKALLLNGHTDTVPADGNWTTDPYYAHISQTDPDKLVGLGASDMKSGLAIMIDISDQAQIHQPPCDIWLLFSSKEETDSSGSLNLASWFAANHQSDYRMAGGIILEPTEAAFVGVGHRGDTIWNVSAEGPEGHASQNLKNTLTAIEKISNFISALPDIRRGWSADYTDSMLGMPTINPVCVQGGAAINVIPRQASATLNVRATPQLAEALPEILMELEKNHDVKIDQSWPPAPTNCDPQAHIYKTMQVVLPPMPFQAFPGSTDQFAFHRQGIPMLIFGPGDLTAMHRPDEYVSLSLINKCQQAIAKVIAAY